ncbi:MAG: histidine phosphatase family protein [Hyphomicrobium sp.]|uniref:histidine phosphatase family protein n=1 Tax=Hyphomicrobium sp. TaxID=82 RepID=UPI001328D93D|nr:histidine phosphatase family protein [Hyphomicrobium sp.]KAB2942612.1 MAG: histidine phosphatase family protein [Hyphomicrobium sp.]MBZ0208596.1 histidine phosphatase family protein [Hyphomicrobium sp.]
MTLIDLIRHGETETPARLLGRTDPPLSEAGWGQFERQTAERAWDAIVSSPLQRARMPAAQLASARGVALRVDNDWAELDFGAWDGRALDELQADAATADAVAALYQRADASGAPGGESWSCLQARVARAIDRLLGEPLVASLLVVTHAGPMRAAIALICAIPFANLWTFRIDPGTRITLRAGRDPRAGLWGEIVEVEQP